MLCTLKRTQASNSNRKRAAKLVKLLSAQAFAKRASGGH